MTLIPKLNPIRDPKWRRHVASQPCIVPGCGRLDCQAAHIRHGWNTMGKKPGDDLCVSLCIDHHREQGEWAKDGGEAGWWMERIIKPQMREMYVKERK